MIFINDLEELEDVLDEITVSSSNIESDNEDSDDEPAENLLKSSDDELDLVDSCLNDMYDYVESNPNAIASPDFHDNLREYLCELLETYFENLEIELHDYECEFNDIIETTFKLFYMIYPRRSYSNTFISSSPNIPEIQEKIHKLKNKYQPAQRTSEWYQTRHNLITASNAYKAFENETTQNQLIFEKCNPPKMYDENAPVSQINIKTPMHWGQKYEPLSVMIYEHKYQTTIGDFGCIQHDTYHFIGASPDGINNDANSDRFGRMLEIKNPVSREIDGLPKKEYWIQMQLQMETCDLDECDFLETKFIEYENEGEFNKDGEFVESADGNMKGIIMYFANKDGNPVYIYTPLHIDNPEDFEIWEQEQMEKNEDKLMWIKNIYWKLEQYSCILVQRNKKWFRDNIATLEKLWKTVELERKTGFEHRAPQRRVKKTETTSEEEPPGGCLITIKKSNDSVSYSPPISSSPMETRVFKIRTESIDETQENMKTSL